MTVLYSILHFLVDGVCAFAMFGYFATQENWYLNILLYNFCAFALQMPLGVVLDGLNARNVVRKYPPSFGFAVLGVMLTLVGAMTHPVVLGLGNALFHLGGGVGTIHEDEVRNRKGRGLGVFVAPGALGLYIGTQLAKNGGAPGWIFLAGVVMLLCLEWGVQMLRRSRGAIGGGKVAGSSVEEQPEGQKLLILGCLAVVILRSYIGMAVGFSWKSTLLAGTIAVFAVVLGKVAGGFSAAGIGVRRTVAVSLGLATVCYLFSDSMILGVAALFFFNMTMPITLYLLVQRLKELPGFAFGLLTFGLFLGFLPVYLGVEVPVEGRFLGVAGSLVSMGILLLCIGRGATGACRETRCKENEGQEVG